MKKKKINDIKIECGLKDGTMFCNGYCDDINSLDVEKDIETKIKDAIIAVSKAIKNIKIVFENVEEDIYKLLFISDAKTITFKVKVDKEMENSIFRRPYSMKLFDTGQKVTTGTLVFMVNAFFIEKDMEEK